jgi:hypothetical protein
MCVCMSGFCNVWVCVGIVMGGCVCLCGCPDNVHSLNLFGYPD